MDRADVVGVLVLWSERTDVPYIIMKCFPICDGATQVHIPYGGAAQEDAEALSPALLTPSNCVVEQNTFIHGEDVEDDRSRDVKTFVESPKEVGF